MGRPLGSRNKAKDGEAYMHAGVEPGMGDNSAQRELTPEQKRSLLMKACDEILPMKLDFAALAGEIRQAYKAAKADGIPKKDIDFALQLRGMDRDTLTERITRHSQIIEWIHPGVQAEMQFEDAAE